MRDFYGCYLLHSKHPNTKDRTYIGFTVNPRRRIKQHNGVIGAGAYKTSKWRPWEMQLVVYGFPTQVQALQFEWAWQHPAKSKAVRTLAAQLGTRGMTGVKGKMRLMLGMLNLPPWTYYPLTIQYLSSTAASTANSLQHELPPHVKVVTAPMEDLPSCLNDDDEDGVSELTKPSVRQTTQSSLPSASCDLTSSQVTGRTKTSSKAAGKAATSSKAAKNSRKTALLSPVIEEDGLNQDTGLQERTLSDNDMQESDNESDNESEGSDPEMLGLTPEQCLPPNGKQWHCDICEQSIERHVLHCSCRRGFHLPCLAAHWTLQENYDPLSDTGMPTLPNQAPSSAARGSASATEQTQSQSPAAAPSATSTKASGKGKVKGKKSTTGKASCPEEETLPVPAQLPERGCCPGCGKEHRWIDLLSKMIPYGYPVKPRVRKTRKRRALKAAVPKKTKDTANSNAGRKAKRKSDKADPTVSPHSPRKGHDLGMEGSDIDMTNMPTPKSTKRPKKKRAAAVLTSDGEEAVEVKAPRRGRPRKVVVDDSAIDIIDASASPLASKPRRRSTSRTRSSDFGDESDKSASGSQPRKERKARGKAVSVIKLSDSDGSEVEASMKPPVAKKGAPSTSKNAKTVLIGNSAAMHESSSGLVVSGKSRKRQQTSKPACTAALPEQGIQPSDQQSTLLLPLAERLRLRLLNQQVSCAPMADKSAQQPSYSNMGAAISLQSAEPVQETSSMSDVQYSSRSCEVDLMVQHANACYLPEENMRSNTANNVPSPSHPSVAFLPFPSGVKASNSDLSFHNVEHNQSPFEQDITFHEVSSPAGVLADNTGMLNKPQPCPAATAVVCSGGEWATTTTLGKHMRAGTQPTVPHNTCHTVCGKPDDTPTRPRQSTLHGTPEACGYSCDGPAAIWQSSPLLLDPDQQCHWQDEHSIPNIQADDIHHLPSGANKSEVMSDTKTIPSPITRHAAAADGDQTHLFIAQAKLANTCQGVLHTNEGACIDMSACKQVGFCLDFDKQVSDQDIFQTAPSGEHQCLDGHLMQTVHCGDVQCEQTDCVAYESPLPCQVVSSYSCADMHLGVDESITIDLTDTPGFAAVGVSEPQQSCLVSKQTYQDPSGMGGQNSVECQVIHLDDD